MIRNTAPWDGRPEVDWPPFPDVLVSTASEVFMLKQRRARRRLSSITGRCPNCGDDRMGYVHVPLDPGICRLLIGRPKP